MSEQLSRALRCGIAELPGRWEVVERSTARLLVDAVQNREAGVPGTCAAMITSSYFISVKRVSLVSLCLVASSTNSTLTVYSPGSSSVSLNGVAIGKPASHDAGD